MITELSETQIQSFPAYVAKWSAIGTNTDPCNTVETKKWIKAAYKVAKCPAPKYFFYFSSPETSVHAIFMVKALEEFDDTYTSTEVFGDTSKWLHIFENLYTQYSTQWKKSFAVGRYHPKWKDANTKARMLSVVSKAYQQSNRNEQLEQHLENMLYGAHDAAWLSFYDFFYQEFDIPCTHDLIPSFEIAKNCGWWSAYSEAAFMQDRPSKIVINDENVIHNESGPAIEYPDNTKIYCLENFWFPENVVMNPESITVEQIESETNAEKRRIMLTRFGGNDGNGYQKYFAETEAKIIHSDYTIVDVDELTGEEMKMPRVLYSTKNGDKYLFGTDGSTKRKYIMPLPSVDRLEGRFGQILTCAQAHQMICGLDETKCVAQS